MTKRKASIFKIAESVPNWFASGGYTVAPLDEEGGPVNNQIGTGLKDRDSAVPAQSTEAQPIAGWAKASPHTWLSEAESNGTASWLEGVLVDRVLADVAEATSSGVVIKTGHPAVEKATEGEATGQQAFWALLRAVGYETW